MRKICRSRWLPASGAARGSTIALGAGASCGRGRACLIYFGYPQAYEDAARRAVHSALAVLAALGDKDPVCIGIHTGALLVGERRGARWQDRDLAGPALETARRCLRLAAPGQVVITEETRPALCRNPLTSRRWKPLRWGSRDSRRAPIACSGRAAPRAACTGWRRRNA